ncbi:MAG: phosphoribosylanthranilate isomerase [Bradyrhizobium sp.]|nr:MAG: phosphoribosylanthranilate isomerase [Bradyrhizobium sp.]
MHSTVKICGLSTAATLEAAIGAGADMVGLVFFAKSPRFVTLDRAEELAARARGRARIVALSVDADDEALAAIVARVSPDILQLHGRETPDRVAAIKQTFGREVMKAIGVSEAGDFAQARDFTGVADWLLIDAKPPKDATRPGGNGRAFDWRLARDFAPSTPWLLSGGLDAANVGEAIALSGAEGVDVSSGVERAPGVKDEAQIAAFAAAARAAFARAQDGRKTQEATRAARSSA